MVKESQQLFCEQILKTVIPAGITVFSICSQKRLSVTILLVIMFSREMMAGGQA